MERRARHGQAGPGCLSGPGGGGCWRSGEGQAVPVGDALWQHPGGGVGWEWGPAGVRTLRQLMSAGLDGWSASGVWVEHASPLTLGASLLGQQPCQ